MVGLVADATGADARRRDAGDAVASSRSANDADAPVPPVTRRAHGGCGRSQRQGSSTMRSTSPASPFLDLTRKTHAPDPPGFFSSLLVLLYTSTMTFVGAGWWWMQDAPTRRCQRIVEEVQRRRRRDPAPTLRAAACGARSRRQSASTMDGHRHRRSSLTSHTTDGCKRRRTCVQEH